MNALTAVTGIIAGAPIAYTAVMALRFGCTAQLELWTTRGEAVMASRWVPDLPAARRRRQRRALLGLTTGIGVIAGITIALTGDTHFWYGLVIAAISAVAYWARVRPVEHADSALPADL
ncbi:hypothetical protein [Actinoplanes sp. L3-i22]|uniref:hypothetical protein n=1 Tax=Actinoplanes sp. L3-i22 TaxID=2836373 RepID=UPI001C74333D|nr:hypothetical protein [Actinoplanes sp. L3-i22]BCY10934.1 hypothetical protein L3i22_060220 [Actinoplanes sp. L3-i22]